MQEESLVFQGPNAILMNHLVNYIDNYNINFRV
jgi:hypothetical protein